MKALKILFNILGILAATILSLFLSVTLFTAPIISTISSFLAPESFYKLFKAVDFIYILDADNTLSPNSKLLSQLANTEFAEDIITLYLDNLFVAMENNSEQPLLTTDDITYLTAKHFDSLLPIAQSHLGTDIPLTEEQLQAYATQYVSQTVTELTSHLPTLKDLGISDTTLDVLHTLYTDNAQKIVLVVIAILSSLILLCRFPRFKGFMWLGINYLSSGLFLFLFALTVKTAGISLFTSIIPISKIIVAPLFSGLTAGVFKGAGIILGFAVAFIVVFIMGRKKLSEKKNSSTMAA